MDERYKGQGESWLEGEHLVETGAPFHWVHSSTCFVSGHRGCKEARPCRNLRKKKKSRRHIFVLYDKVIKSPRHGPSESVQQWNHPEVDRVLQPDTPPTLELIHTSILRYVSDAAQYFAAIFNQFIPAAVGTAGFQKGPSLSDMIITKLSFFTFAVSISWHIWQPHEFLDCKLIHNDPQPLGSSSALCSSLLATAEAASVGFTLPVVPGRSVPLRTVAIFVADLVRKVAPKGT